MVVVEDFRSVEKPEDQLIAIPCLAPIVAGFASARKSEVSHAPSLEESIILKRTPLADHLINDLPTGI